MTGLAGAGGLPPALAGASGAMTIWIHGALIIAGVEIAVCLFLLIMPSSARAPFRQRRMRDDIRRYARIRRHRPSASRRPARRSRHRRR